MVQRLGPWAMGLGLIPSQGTRILQVSQYSQKKKEHQLSNLSPWVQILVPPLTNCVHQLLSFYVCLQYFLLNIFILEWCHSASSFFTEIHHKYLHLTIYFFHFTILFLKREMSTLIPYHPPQFITIWLSFLSLL